MYGRCGDGYGGELDGICGERDEKWNVNVSLIDELAEMGEMLRKVTIENFNPMKFIRIEKGHLRSRIRLPRSDFCGDVRLNLNYRL